MTKKRLGLAVLLAAVLGLGFAATTAEDDDFFAIRKSIEIYGAAYKALVGQYVNDPDPERLMQSGLEAMLADLDPYTTLLDEADRTEALLRKRGGYGDVGLSLGRRGGKVVVTAPEENARAYEQGLRTGDVLLRVAGRAVDNLTLADVHELLRGEPGTSVKVKVQREGQPELMTFVLSRQKVDRRTVSHSGIISNDVGYVRLDRFGRRSGQEVRKAMKKLQKQRELNGFVLDLRGNPGGLLEQAVAVTGLFVPQGTEVVSMRGRTAQTQRTYRSKKAPLAPDVPLAVLIDDISASASEIVAGAVQDLDRGVLVGETSFGKGLVQKVEQLPYNTALKLTVAEYFTPSGRNIQSKDYRRDSAATIPDSLRETYETKGGRTVRGGGGIMPDVKAAPPKPGALEQALKRRASFFFFANDYAARRDTLPDGFAVDDALLADFREWLEGRGFSYESDAQRALQALKGEVKKEGYAGAVRGDLKALRQALQQQKQRAFERHSSALKGELRRAILARYLDRSGQRAALMEHERALQEALRLLGDDGAYNDLLR